MMSDRGRLVFAIAVLYLHADEDEAGARLTPGRIAAFCRETGLCSAGRARATFALMRWLGHIEPDEPGSDGSVRSFRPTSQLIDRFRERWRRQFERLVEIRPEHRELLVAVDRPEFLLALAVALGRAYRAGYRALEAVPSLAAAADRKSGLLILLALLHADQTGAQPPAIAELARQFGVSRAHIHAVLRLGVDADLLDWDPGRGEIAVHPALREAVEELFAGVFSMFAAAGELALASAAECSTDERLRGLSS